MLSVVSHGDEACALALLLLHSMNSRCRMVDVEMTILAARGFCLQT